MRPEVPDDLKRAVSQLVSARDTPFVSRAADARDIDATLGDRYWLGDVLPDLAYFRFQNSALQNVRDSQYVAILRDDGPKNDPLPVPLRVPDLQNANASYEFLLNHVSKSGWPLEKVSAKQAEEFFVDRVSEFVAAQTVSTKLTTVHSKRKGDTVLCAKGYFVSTGTGFGVSTPAQGYLSGRYSFGIMDAGRPRFDNVIWTCPTVAKIDLP